MMKCECSRCNGTGEIECPNCDGFGTVDGSILDVKLDEGHPHYEQLARLQEDAQRITNQFHDLCKVKPASAQSYETQYRQTIAEIESQADKVKAE